ncbi:MAG: hypothetical protein K8S14_07685 [Actinomycetia bacterium]|nr:hypothetical protein [Actinomycetes bacterium]
MDKGNDNMTVKHSKRTSSRMGDECYSHPVSISETFTCCNVVILLCFYLEIRAIRRSVAQ